MVKLLGGGSDLNSVVSDMNQNLLELKGEEVRKVIRDEQGTRVVVLDKDGLRTTAPGGGIDVMTATAAQLTSNSAQNMFKIAQRTRTLTSTGFSFNCADFDVEVVDQVDSYTHGLGFTPQIIGATVDAGDYYPLPFTSDTAAATGVLLSLKYQVFANSTHLSTYVQLTVTNISGSPVNGNIPAADFKVYLLQETAN